MSLTKTAKISEANVSRAIQELLAAKRIRFHRLNAGSRLVESKGKRYCIRMQEKGCADLLALVRHRIAEQSIDHVRPCMRTEIFPLYIEVKRPGGKQSPEQTAFEYEVTQYGMKYLLADSIDTVIDWLKARGI